MMSNICVVIIICVLLLEYNAAGRNNRRNSRQRSRKNQQFPQALNDFGISLYKELAPDNDNLALAPIGVVTTMSMVMFGSRGDTELNLFQGLKLQPLRQARKVHRKFKAFTQSLNNLPGNVTFDTANALYVQPDTSVQRQYLKKIKKYYNGKVNTFDFSYPDGPEAPINEWIETKTSGMIENFLEPGSVEADTAMWLINAIYFKGTWDWIFDEQMTNQHRFQVSPTEEVQVSMMHNDHMYATKTDQALGVKVLELPYDGERFSFFIILPDVVGLNELESRLDYQTLENLLTNLNSPSRFEISIPKFKLTSEMNLVDYLKELGVTKVFQHGEADLSGINGQQNLYVDEVKQKVVLEVNERGTVAAAVTGGRVSLTSLPPQFVVDRPFMYVLRDKSTAINLFIGRVNNPANAI